LESKEQQLKMQEDSTARRFSELEKLNALLEQKLQLTEQENVDQKTRIHQREQQAKDLNKQLGAALKQAEQ
jgi:hypothetical protein